MDSAFWHATPLNELVLMLLGAVLSLALLATLAFEITSLWKWRAGDSEERRNHRLALACGWIGTLCGIGFGISGVLLLLQRPDTLGWATFDAMEGIGTLGAMVGCALAWLMCGFAIPEEG